MTDTPHSEYEKWLRTVCFQKPTPEAYDLAKCAWAEASKQIELMQAVVDAADNFMAIDEDNDVGSMLAYAELKEALSQLNRK